MALNRLSASTTTIVTMPNDNTTSSIINLASDYALVSVPIDDIMNCVKSHIFVTIWYPSWFLCSAVPGDHIYRCIISNGMVTGQKMYNSSFLILKMLYDMQ